MAQLTIEINNAHIPRIKQWMLDVIIGYDPDDPQGPALPTDAELLEELRSMIKLWVKDQVQDYELKQQHEDIFQQYTTIEVD